MSKFSEVLLEARLSRNMTRSQLAKLTGFSNAFIGAYEQSAQNPTIKTLVTYCRALGLTCTIDTHGITITDTHTDVDLLTAWVPEYGT